MKSMECLEWALPRHRAIVSGMASALLLCSVSLAPTGCASTANSGASTIKNTASTPPPSARTSASSRTSIVLDGDVSDWPTSSAAWADQHHLYLRFSVVGEPFTLQSAPETTAILIDLDANPATGWRPEATGELSGLGVDLEVQSSPIRDGRRSNGAASRFGMAMFTLTKDGTRTPTDAYAWDVAIAPTFASAWYEARLSRTPTTPTSGLPALGMLGSGPIAGAFVTYDARGGIDAASEAFRIEAPPQCTDGPRRSTLEVPAKDPRAIRVMSYNVLRSSPETKPEVYARIFAALQPDVVLVQEWENQDNLELEEWFNSNVPTPTGWQAVVLPGTVATGAGVGVVSRFPLTLAASQLMLEPDAAAGLRQRTQVRFVAAQIDTPVGTMIAGSTHLKSRGSKDSPEDKRRMLEARSIRSAVLAGLANLPGAMVVIAGDMNLVGSRPPLEALREGLDSDGSSLAIASAMVLGDRTFTTWSEAGNEFGPGRLDYVLYSDHAATQRDAFVLDTARLSDGVLEQAGLRRGDSAGASDHMPVVVDLIPR
jgi:endonuclease/exonuclease/phosphatase family metal-dependent hydrolase